jgi:Tfp pilus assembly protein PilF
MKKIFWYLSIILIFSILPGCAKKEEVKKQTPEIPVPTVKPEADIHLRKAFKFLNEKKLDKAISEIEKAVKIQPDNGIILATAGSIYEQKRDKEKALYYYKEALKYQPTRQDCKEAIARIEGEQTPSGVREYEAKGKSGPIKVKEYPEEKRP